MTQIVYLQNSTSVNPDARKQCTAINLIHNKINTFTDKTCNEENM